MQKVVGSNPISRFLEARSRSGFRPSVCVCGPRSGGLRFGYSIEGQSKHSSH